MFLWLCKTNIILGVSMCFILFARLFGVASTVLSATSVLLASLEMVAWLAMLATPAEIGIPHISQKGFAGFVLLTAVLPHLSLAIAGITGWIAYRAPWRYGFLLPFAIGLLLAIMYFPRLAMRPPH